MNNVQQYLKSYLEASQSNNDDNWESFLAKEKPMMDKTKENLKECLKFLPTNQLADFHDSYVIGNVKPNINDNTFDITIRMLAYEKLEDPSLKHPYQEVEPVYVKFTLDNKHRDTFHKLAVKCDTILSVVYDEQNLGIAYLNKDYKTKTISLEGIDLSNNQAIDKPLTKKFRM